MKLSAKRHLPSIANIEAFLSVARLGSMTAAAEELFLTQGAVSKQILELEKYVGTALFTRTTHGLLLTPAGKVLAEQVSPLVAGLSEAFSAARGTRAVINFSVPPSLGMEIVTPHLSEFLEQHPSLLVNVFSRLGEVDLDKEGLDAAIIAREYRGGPYNAERLFVPALYPYVSPALLRGAPPGVNALQHCKLVGIVTMPKAWPDYFAELGLAFDPSMVGTNHSLLSTAAQAVMSGYGVALLPVFVAGQHERAGHMVRITEHAYGGSNPYYLISRRNMIEGEGFHCFRGWLLSLLQRLGLMEQQHQQGEDPGPTLDRGRAP